MKVSTCRDPREAAKASARAMLDRIVPFEQSAARHQQVFFPEFEIYSARDLHDRIVAELRREAVDPCPTGFLVDQHGHATPTWGTHDQP